MTEKELIEQIAIEIAGTRFSTWNKLGESERENWRRWVKERIFLLFRKAGWVDLTAAISGNLGASKATEIMAYWAEANGYVRAGGEV